MHYPVFSPVLFCLRKRLINRRYEDFPPFLLAFSRDFKVFPYVNGGLFKERYPIPKLSRRARTLILNCGEYDWKEINPDIFGSMIQAVVTPEKRAGLGMHYTSVTNIEKLIRPIVS